MVREPEPAPLTPERGSGRKHAPDADRGHAPWEEDRDGELHAERGKAPPRSRKHRIAPEAGRLMENDHLEAEQLEHQRQVMRSKHADNDLFAREQMKRRTNRASQLREKAGGLRRAAAQRQDQDVVTQENADLAPRKGRAAPAEAKSRWAEPRRPGGTRKVLRWAACTINWHDGLLCVHCNVLSVGRSISSADQCCVPMLYAVCPTPMNDVHRTQREGRQIPAAARNGFPAYGRGGAKKCWRSTSEGARLHTRIILSASRALL